MAGGKPREIMRKTMNDEEKTISPDASRMAASLAKRRWEGVSPADRRKAASLAARARWGKRRKVKPT